MNTMRRGAEGVRPRVCRAAWLLALLALPAFGAWAAAPLQIVQPSHLSTVEPTPVQIQAPSGTTGALAYTLTLSDEEGLTQSVLRGMLSPDNGSGAATLWVQPGDLAAFSLDEAVVLDLAVGATSASAEATILPEAAATEASSWAITFSGRPAQVYTTKDTTLTLQVTNPKTSAKNAQIKVMFLNAKGQKKAMAVTSALLAPGSSDQSVDIPASLATTAKASTCTQAKAVLLVGGVVKATQTVPADYDLAGEGSASPDSGIAPLAVTFSGSASGGTPPYAYTWDFGDGGSGTGDSPGHNYPHAGTFDWTLAVTDAVNGTAGASGTVTVTPGVFHALSVNVGPGASGTPAAGTYNYLEGSTVPYAYSSSACYENISVTLDGAPAPASGTLTMNADHALAVSAALKTFTITAASGAGGTISPPGATVVNCGGSQGYTISANLGFLIQDVLVDGVSAGAIGTYTFTGVVANHTLSATFVAVGNRTLTVDLGPGTSGTPAATASYPVGTVVSYAYALADTCYEGLAVSLDGASAPASGTVTMNANHTLAVAASLQNFSIDASGGHGGTISPSGRTNVPCGASQTYTMTPQGLYQVADVKVDGISVGALTSYTFTDVRASHTIAAIFSPVRTYTLGVTLGAGVTGTPSASGTFAQGALVDYAYALADACRQGLVVTLDGAPASPSGTITMDRNHTLSATSSAVGYLLAVDMAAGTSGTPASSMVYACNQSVNYSYSLLVGYKNFAVTLDGEPAPASGTVLMDRTHHLVVAATPITFTITASVTGGTGTITPSGPVTVSYNGSQLFTFSPGLGYQVWDVLVDGTSVGHPTSYNFTNVLADHTLQVFFMAPLSVSCLANPPVGVAPLTVSFVANPLGGLPASYAFAWDFGDGATSTEQNPSHEYAAIGNYTATVTLSDGVQTAQCQVSVTTTINHDPAVIDLVATPSTITLGTPSVVSFTLTDPDPGDGITWTATLTQTPTGLGTLDVTSGGPVASGTGQSLKYIPLKACSPGPCSATIQITATDPHGGTNSQSVVITVN